MTAWMNEKTKPLDQLLPIIREEQRNGKRFVFTNGCFDLIHVGHTRYLQEARSAGDYLIIGVNSDRSVQELKGPTRPIVPLSERLEILASLYFVDWVLPFDEQTPFNLIEQIKPDILIKGGDWDVEKIVGKDIVERHGGKVFTIPEIPGGSTTGIIERILERFKNI